ncbi:MAG: hypothetical protein ACK46X_17290 [Candidatus Sericytochromatia bacterium]
MPFVLRRPRPPLKAPTGGTTEHPLALAAIAVAAALALKALQAGYPGALPRTWPPFG